MCIHIPIPENVHKSQISNPQPETRSETHGHDPNLKSKSKREAEPTNPDLPPRRSEWDGPRHRKKLSGERKEEMRWERERERE